MIYAAQNATRSTTSPHPWRTKPKSASHARTAARLFTKALLHISKAKTAANVRIVMFAGRGVAMDNIAIRIITENKKNFLPLLLLGDESEDQIDKYLERSELFTLYDGDLKCMCAITDEGGGILEIQNLATDERYQRQGYASMMIEHVAKHYKNRYDKIVLGTGDVPGILSFYERCGFKITHRIADYFTQHYDHPIIEDGILLRDKVYLERLI